MKTLKQYGLYLRKLYSKAKTSQVIMSYRKEYRAINCTIKHFWRCYQSINQNDAFSIPGGGKEMSIYSAGSN